MAIKMIDKSFKLSKEKGLESRDPDYILKYQLVKRLIIFLLVLQEKH